MRLDGTTNAYPNAYQGGNPGYPVSTAREVVDESRSQIRDTVSAIEQTLSEVHDAIGRLEKRLDTVLTPVPPQPAGVDSKPSIGPASSHLHGRMVILNEGFQSAANRLRDLTQRVEV